MNESFDNEHDWLQHTLTDDIPLGGAMALTVARLDGHGVALDLPLDANVNDKGTAFGGSLASAMILAGWSLPRLLMRRAELSADLVIGRCEIRFVMPVTGPFQALCAWPESAECERFVQRLADTGRAGLNLHPEIRMDGQVAATLSARYAALGRTGGNTE